MRHATLALALIAVPLLLGADKKKPAPSVTRYVAYPSYNPQPGDAAFLFAGAGQKVYVTMDPQAFDALEKVFRSKDQVGLDELVKGQRVLALTSPVPILVMEPAKQFQRSVRVPGTNDRTTQVETHSFKVRLREGEQKDQVVWAGSGYVSRAIEVRAPKKRR